MLPLTIIRRIKTGSRRRRAHCAPPDGIRCGDLAAIVRAYKDCGRAKLRAQLASFRAEPSLSSAVQRAGLAMRPDGKRYDHQRRLKRVVLQKGTRRLQNASLKGAPDFDALYRIVEGTIGLLHGIGEITVYDTALRIGAKLGVKPRLVYVHGGTRQGARALNLGLAWRLPYLPPSAFPPQLQELEPHEIEDCLCIFRDKLSVRRGV